MGKPTGFKEYPRLDLSYAPVEERIRHYREFTILPPAEQLQIQGARCMDCGIPFCHEGCPVNNLIPDWNDLVYHGRWRPAIERLHATNNFPEFTGRVCPAPCEAACTLNIEDEPVTIKLIERSVVDRAWDEGWITPGPMAEPTGRRVAVVGSGPAGMACAQQLARLGHAVTVFEKADRVGGLLRYGIPDFKLEKWVIDRRLEQMRAEGVEFRTGVHVGVDLPARQLVEEHDAVVLCGGSEKPRDLDVPGRELSGIHFAMEFLPQQNRRVAGDAIPADEAISAEGKHVVVIGGGDTGSDCIGTSIRQGALSVTQLEILPKPPEKEDKALTWPNWPNKLRTSTSQEEGARREWCVATQAFHGSQGRVERLEAARVQWDKDEAGHWQMRIVPGSEFELEADLVLIAMGFVHPVHEGMLDELGVEYDPRGNVAATTGDYRASLDKVFSAGDMRRGQSLVVWAIREGRQAAEAVDAYLMEGAGGTAAEALEQVR